MKNILVVSKGETTGNAITKQIMETLGDLVRIETIQTENPSTKCKNFDLVIFTSEILVDFSILDISEETPHIIANRVIDHKNIEPVISLSENTDVVLVNDSDDSAFEAVKQLKEIGLDHLNYFPYYPNCSSYPTISIAITPGEPHLVPPWIDNVINIGTRILDLKTIYEIMNILDLGPSVKESLTSEYIKDIVSISKSIDESRKSVIKSQRLLESIFNNVSSGIAYVDKSGRILQTNFRFKSMLNLENKRLKDLNLTELNLKEEILLDKNTSSIIQIQNREILINIDSAVFFEDEGFIITAEYIEKISKMDHKIRRNQEKKFSKKHHTFDDYMSMDESTMRMIARAKKFAKTDATILIQGENGTGKEIIAQSIHFESERNENPFIPVNIAAISPNLLESELFGYEEGSFTGALKGGKAGLFEIANGGTLFIDEIGDAPLEFQVKLLRVLQEKKIRRVGGSEEIPVDLRIISATNKNLLELVEKDRFREDLFFRLNILPLKTIPLRMRRCDIDYLLLQFIGEKFKKPGLSLSDLFYEETLEFLNSYRWMGNVRELINLCEYLYYTYEDEKFTIADLPFYIRECASNRNIIHLGEDEVWTLEKFNSKTPLGRISLKKLAEDEGKHLGEGRIRTLIKRLKDLGLIEDSISKKGSVISKYGKDILYRTFNS